MNRDDIIREAGLELWILSGRTYPHPLPKDLEPYYCYTRDGGHSILVVLENEYKRGSSPIRFMIPAPVKTVLKSGYQVRDGMIWAVLLYDRGKGSGLRARTWNTDRAGFRDIISFNQCRDPGIQSSCNQKHSLEDRYIEETSPP